MIREQKDSTVLVVDGVEGVPSEGAGSPGYRARPGVLRAPLGVPCPAGAATLVLAVVCFSAADAFLTLKLLLMGAVEINPVMSALMGRSVNAFVNWKLLVTASASLFLLMVFDVRLFRGFTVRRILEALVVGYAVLVLYESVLLIVVY